jgi:mono/diheme cytochrome c family protein
MWRVVAILGCLAAACGGGSGGGTDGRALFEATCARCHGNDGRGEEIARIRLGVPDMTQAAFQDRVTDSDIKRTVREGSHSKKMPGFGTYYDDAQLEAIARHVRKLALDHPRR